MKSILSICPKHKISSLCIGKFDGIHIGHQALLSKIDRQNGGLLRISQGEPLLITPCIQDFVTCSVYEVELEQIRDFDCIAFVEFLKEHFTNLEKIVVGYDFRFGKDRCCYAKDLEKFFDVCIVDQIKVDGFPVHRKNILSALENGQINRANAMLGREYCIAGEVIRGQGRGSKECVPTINLEVRDYFLPKSGVYVTWSEVGGVRYKSVSFLGDRLSSDGKFAIETHLLEDCVMDVPKEAKIYFVHFLRENQKFDSLHCLKQQIQQDILEAKSFLH